MSERTTLLLSNHWHNPGISLKVVHHPAEAPEGSIALEMDLEDFRQAVLAELKHPTRIWTAAQLDAQLAAAFDSAVEKVKHVTVGTM